ncbi:MAG: flagellin [Sphingomonadales bacterium]
MVSINTNPSALVALQNLNKTTRALEQTQDRVNTGLKVAGAKDNGAIFAIAQNLRADISGLTAVMNSVDRGIGVSTVALAAGESISDLLIDLKAKAAAASDVGLDTASRAALNNEFISLRDQINTIVGNAEFNGTNMIKNGGDAITALANDTGTATINVSPEDLSLTGTTLVISTTTTIGASATTAASVLAEIDTSITNVNAALARLGTGVKALERHKIFTGKLSDTIEVGVGNLVDADLAKESARLQALQVKQQLGVQALSIANQSPQSILSLFRG